MNLFEHLHLYFEKVHKSNTIIYSALFDFSIRKIPKVKVQTKSLPLRSNKHTILIAK